VLFNRRLALNFKSLRIFHPVHDQLGKKVWPAIIRVMEVIFPTRRVVTNWI
jgi:hypothetical protein